MSCADFEDRVARYVDGERDAAVERHLRVCEPCAEFAAALEADREMLLGVPPETGEVDFVALRRRIRQGIHQERRRSGWWWIPAAAAMAAVMLAVWFWPPAIPVPSMPPAPQAKAIGNWQAKTPAPQKRKRRVAVERVPRPDPVLEQALQQFLDAEAAAEAKPVEAPPVQIRIVGSNPSVVLILMESRGESYE